MRDTNAGAVFGAFLGGALLGGVIALLFAPRSGAQTRGMIRDFAEREVDLVKDKLAEARDYVEDEIDEVKRKARRAVDELRGTVDGARECVETEVKKVARR